MTIQEIISRYLNAREAESQQAGKPSSQYNMQAHYAACDATSYWAVQMINHSDWSVELADKFYPQEAE